MDRKIMIPRDEYMELKEKAELFDRYIETDEFSKDEITKIRKALKGPFITEAEFLKKHPELE
jgi:hypothetical protein